MVTPGQRGVLGRGGGPRQPAKLPVTGPQGNRGQSGVPGPQGVPGETGPTGPQGPTGATGATGAASSVPGPTGPAGATGPTGPAGLSGITAIGTVTNATTSLSLTGVYIAPANSLVSGTSFAFRSYLFYTRSGAGALNVVVIIAVAGVTRATVTLAAPAGNGDYAIDVYGTLTFLSSGVACVANMVVHNQLAATNATTNKAAHGTAVDPTITNTIELFASMSAAVAGSVLTVVHGNTQPAKT